jgi:F0F1-type ATP synthase membrane subunit b/b'
MTPGVSVMLAVVGLIVTAIPVYYLAKANAREARRQRNQEIADAVGNATGPLQAANAGLQETVRDQRQTIRDLRRRIDELEDQLREGAR